MLTYTGRVRKLLGDMALLAQSLRTASANTPPAVATDFLWVADLAREMRYLADRGARGLPDTANAEHKLEDWYRRQPQ